MELADENKNLLGHATKLPSHARISLPCHLLVAEPASGVSGMAHAACSRNASCGIQACTDIGWTRRSLCRALDV